MADAPRLNGRTTRDRVIDNVSLMLLLLFAALFALATIALVLTWPISLVVIDLAAPWTWIPSILGLFWMATAVCAGTGLVKLERRSPNAFSWLRIASILAVPAAIGTTLLAPPLSMCFLYLPCCWPIPLGLLLMPALAGCIAWITWQPQREQQFWRRISAELSSAY